MIKLRLFVILAVCLLLITACADSPLDTNNNSNGTNVNPTNEEPDPYEYDAGNIRYLITGSTAEVIFCTTGVFSDPGIPETVQGATVTSIGDEAFKNCSILGQLELPQTIESIGARAFEGCASLRFFNS